MRNCHNKQWTKFAANKLCAYIYLENVDQAKFGSVLKIMSQQKSFGTDQYPDTITKSNNILSNHNFYST